MSNLLYYLAAFGSPNVDGKYKILTHNLKYIHASINTNFDLFVNVYDNTMLDNITVPVTENKQTPNDSFFISNYCFTAIDSIEQAKYVNKIIQPCSHGFLTWQTCFGSNVDSADDILKKSIVNRPEETPQTAPKHVKNHYVYF